MHECPERGYLRSGTGSPISEEQLARMVGTTLRTVRRLLSELESAGVFSRAEDGTILSRRMVRDEEFRAKRITWGEQGKEFGHRGSEFGKLGGRPRKKTRDETGGNGGFMGVLKLRQNPPLHLHLLLRYYPLKPG
jgi:hypothetical protein